jgi:hypothetical protein
VQPTDQSLQSVLDEVKSLTEQLLAAPCSELSHIPTSQGVYAIYDKNGKIIYVGKGKNLNRRIFQDHLGGDLKMSTSTFRRSVNRVYGIGAGKTLKEWSERIARSRSFWFQIPIYVQQSRGSGEVG